MALKSALDILQERPLSPDQFKTFSKCQKKYWLQYIQRLNWPSDQRNFELGKNVHKLMEYQARGLTLDHLLDAAGAEIRVVWQRLSQHQAANWPIVASEWAFALPLQMAEALSEDSEVLFGSMHKYWLAGRIDRIAWQPESQTLWVLDWKTGTAAPKRPETDWQTRIYLWAVMQNYQQLKAGILDAAVQQQLPEMIRADQIKFLYLEVSVKDPAAPIREIPIAFDAKRFQQYQTAIQQQLGNICARASQNAFPLPEKCPDIYCQYSPVCGIKSSLGELHELPI